MIEMNVVKKQFFSIKKLAKKITKKTADFAKSYHPFQNEPEQPGSPEVEVPDPDIKEDENVFNKIGYGVLSYFIVTRTLLKTFLIGSYVFIPLMTRYIRFDSTNPIFGASWIDETTFASFGSSEAKCVTIKPFDEIGDGLMFGCESGLIKEITSIGAYQRGSEAAEYGVCSSKLIFNTGLDCPEIAHLALYLSQHCLDREACLLDQFKTQLPSTCELDSSTTVYV